MRQCESQQQALMIGYVQVLKVITQESQALSLKSQG